MKETTRRLWNDRIERWQARGLDAKAFAKSEGISPKTLQNWRWRSKREHRELRAVQKPAQFIELISTPQRSATTSAAFEIVLGDGARVIVPARFEPSALGTLLGLLRGDA